MLYLLWTALIYFNIISVRAPQTLHGLFHICIFFFILNVKLSGLKNNLADMGINTHIHIHTYTQRVTKKVYTF